MALYYEKEIIETGQKKYSRELPKEALRAGAIDTESFWVHLLTTKKQTKTSLLLSHSTENVLGASVLPQTKKWVLNPQIW